MARYPLTGSRVSLSASIREREMHWKGGNYCSLKLTEQVMKVLERIVDGLIRQLVSIDDSQFGFIPGRGTTDATFVVRQLQEKYLAANKTLYMAFIDLEKTSDRLPRKIIWWALRKLGVEEWIVRLVQGCMQMRGGVSVLVRGTVKSLKWRSVFTKAQYSARFSSSLCLKLFHESSALVSLGGPLCQWPCYYHWIACGMCQKALDLERSNGKERTESKCRRDKDHDLQYGPGPPAEFSKFPCAIYGTRVGSNSIFCNDCKHWVLKKCSGLKRLTKDPDYRCTWCQGTARPLDSRPQREVRQTWQAGSGSFCLLHVPRRHALSSRWLWNFNHNTCENCLEEVQEAATSSLFTPPLFQDMWPCIQLLHAERNAPCQWDLAIDKTKPPTSAGEWSDRSVMSGCKALSPHFLDWNENKIDINLLITQFVLRIFYTCRDRHKPTSWQI